MYIINKYIDWLFAGGISLLLYAIIWVFDINLLNHNIGITAFLLANIINNPHFIASYGLLYVDERKKIFSSLYYIFVSTIVPILLVGIFIFAIITKQPSYIGYLLNLMFFMVGLHYVRQIYGIGLISLAKMKVYLPDDWKKVLNYTLFPAWFLSYLNGNTAVYTQNFYGIGYQTFGLPPFLKDANMIMFYLSVIIWMGLIIYVVHVHKKWPVTLMIVLASISLWHFPRFYDSGFAYLIPLFHSLQYLLIVIAVKKNQIGGIKKYMRYIFYILSIGIIAYLAFRFVPEFLDRNISYDKSMFGPTLYLAMFLIFINIHHYFIDAIIWRKGSGVAKQV